MTTMHKVNFKIHYKGEDTWSYKVNKPLEPRELAARLIDSWEESGWSLRDFSYIEVEGHYFIRDHGRLVEVFDVLDEEIPLE